MEAVNVHTKQVSGPINVIRLQGKIGEVDKIIYIIIIPDISVEYQNSCINPFSRDIKEYLAEALDDMIKTDNIYDFFLPSKKEEMDHTLSVASRKNRDPYLVEAIKLFGKILFRPKEQTSLSRYSSKIRLHYPDLNNHLGYFVNRIITEIIQIIFRLTGSINIRLYNSLLPRIQLLHDIYLWLLNIIKQENQQSVTELLKKFLEEDDGELISHIDFEIAEKHQKQIAAMIDKWLNNYHHTKVKNILVSKIKDELISKIEKALLKLDETYDELDQINRKFTKVFDENDNETYYTRVTQAARDAAFIVGEALQNIAAVNIMLHNIYTLRRFLDKNRITHAIVLYGDVPIIQTLIKDFGFKITHTAFSRIENMEELNTVLRNEKNLPKLERILFPPKLEQCVDLTHFPTSFS